jgi:hypothetical protein
MLLALAGCVPRIDVVTVEAPSDLLEDEVVCAGVRTEDDERYSVVAVGMDSLAWVPMVELAEGSPTRSNAVALMGDHLAVCGPELLRVELATGAVSTYDVTCEGIVDVDGGFVVFVAVRGEEADPRLVWYPTFDDVVSGANGTPLPVLTTGSRIGRGDVELLTSWHAGNEVERWDPFTGEDLSTSRLEGYNTWIEGLSAVGERLFVMNDGRDDFKSGTRIAEFDLDGPALRDLVLGEGVTMQGLGCTSETLAEPIEGESLVGRLVLAP